MSKREIIPFLLAAIGGIGGLVNALVSMSMVDAVNPKRPPDDQIPSLVTRWKDYEWLLQNFPFPYRRPWKEYLQQFPKSRLYFWHVVSLIWMFGFFLICWILLVAWFSPHDLH
jgi:hypothetical protein